MELNTACAIAQIDHTCVTERRDEGSRRDFNSLQISSLWSQFSFFSIDHPWFCTGGFGGFARRRFACCNVLFAEAEVENSGTSDIILENLFQMRSRWQSSGERGVGGCWQG